MNIFKGPQTTDNFDKTDSKPLSELLDDWTPNKKILFDGTIDKSGERHTDIGVQLTPDDITSLNIALFRYHTERIKELQNKNRDYRDKEAELRETIRKLQDALSEISYFIEDHSDDESSTELLVRLKKIADQQRAESDQRQGA